MGLFSKKYCDICGSKIGLLGNKKLEDGNMCRECAAKLSPWFQERKHATVAEIREQLAYREENRKAVAAFHTTRSLGRYMRVLVDEDAGKFMVTNAENPEEANPDVIDISEVTDVDTDIQETRWEIRREVRDSEGNVRRESYQPPRYRYTYTFYLKISVNHPYFSKIPITVSDSAVEFEYTSGTYGRISGPRTHGLTSPPPLSLRRENADYARYEEICREITDVLTGHREDRKPEREEAQTREEPAAPKQKVTCPWCGAVTAPDESGCCEFCGGSVNA